MIASLYFHLPDPSMFPLPLPISPLFVLTHTHRLRASRVLIVRLRLLIHTYTCLTLFCTFPRCCLEPSEIDLWNYTLMSCPVLSWKPFCTSDVVCHLLTAVNWSKSCWTFRYFISSSALKCSWNILISIGITV